MGMKYALVLLLLAPGVLVSCGPSTEEIAQVAEEMAVTMVAETAEAEAKFVLALEQTRAAQPTSTETATATITSSPTATKTLTPTPTVTGSPTRATIHASTVTVTPTATSTATAAPGSPWVLDDVIIGASVSASADLDAFNQTWAEPGVTFSASPVLPDHSFSFGGTTERWLDYVRDMDFLQACEYTERVDYEDQLYSGQYDVYENCGGEGSIWFNLAAVPIDDPNAFMIDVGVQIVSEADLNAWYNILDSFVVLDELPNEWVWD